VLLNAPENARVSGGDNKWLVRDHVTSRHQSADQGTLGITWYAMNRYSRKLLT
jgi:hypothetical protein